MIEWVSADWLPAVDDPLTGRWISIDAPQAEVRLEGGVIAAARYRVAEFGYQSLWGSTIEIPGAGVLHVISSWILAYPRGGFVGLHTDRPDSDLTGLIALDACSDPVVLCPALSGRDDCALAEEASRDPHPIGVPFVLRRREALLISGAAVPHHRPPVSAPCTVLSITLKRV